MTLFHIACIAAILVWQSPLPGADAPKAPAPRVQVAVPQAPTDPARFERELLVPAARDAIQLEVLANGDILFAEFWGTLKLWSAGTKLVTTLGQVPTYAKGELGLLGMAAARDFERTGYVFVLFCPTAKQDTMRVSRFTVKDGKIAAGSERELLSWPYDTEHVYHMGGAMWMDAKGLLYIGNGDNCHWNPGLPLDTRPGRKSWDAQRTAANSADLRGKVLRIQPLADGSYRIPDGNLFPGGKGGRPEIYVMGVRNPFRIAVDDQTGALFVGDVGPNVLPELGVNPVGYDEIHVTHRAANLGWPYFIGPNETLPLFDFEKKREIRRQDPRKPTNDSPNNTGAKALPPAQPALIWYSSVPSKTFPTLGSGGRSIMAGPLYHYDAANPSLIKLPQSLDGRLFIYEWMRNWIQTVSLNPAGAGVEPFLPEWNFRRPIDMKLGRDGALYLIEYGDQWWENNDSRIVRVIYRRGNRAPQARLISSETAGAPPLTLSFDASTSTDADNDKLMFDWAVAGKIVGHGPKYQHTFRERGSHAVSVTVSDTHGATAIVRETIHAGNGRPTVRFTAPAHGSFFDWNASIPYKLAVTETDGDTVYPNLATVAGEFRGRRLVGDGADEVLDPGLAAMRKSTCFSCHMANTPSAGPPYKAVALKYKDDAAAPERLAVKVLSGASGAWGAIPMPPHPQHTLAQVRPMIAWVLSLKDDPSAPPKSGSEGSFQAPPKPAAGSRADEGVLVLTASYTDDGKEGTLPRLRGEASVVLHSRRKKAALYDTNRGMAYVEQVEGETGIIGHFKDGAYIVWRDLNLSGIRRLKVRAGCFDTRGGVFELRRNSPDGALLLSVPVNPTGEGEFIEMPAALPDVADLVNLCVVARCGDKRTVLGLNWIEFLP